MKNSWAIFMTLAVVIFLFLLMNTTQHQMRNRQTVTYNDDITFHQLNSGKFVEYSPNGYYIVKVSLPSYGSDTVYLRVSESAVEKRTNLTNYETEVQKRKTREEPD